MLIIGIMAGVLLATSATAFASGSFTKISALLRPDYSVKVDGKPVEMQNAPIAYNGTTYVPLREAGKILGYKVGFENGTITLNQIEKDVAGVTTATTTPAAIDVTNGDWVLLRDITTKFRTDWGGEQGNIITRDDGVQLTFWLPGGEKGEFTMETSEGNIRAYATSGIIYIFADDVRAIGFLPQ